MHALGNQHVTELLLKPSDTLHAQCRHIRGVQIVFSCHKHRTAHRKIKVMAHCNVQSWYVVLDHLVFLLFFFVLFFCQKFILNYLFDIIVLF